MDERLQKLASAIDELREINVNDKIRKCDEITNIINLFFDPDAKCDRFIYTENYDKLAFGCIVFPIIDRFDINKFMITGETNRITKYQVELDSKLFDYGLTNEEICAVILYDIYHMIKDLKPMENLRMAIDNYVTMTGEVINVRNTVQYDALFRLGCTDALHQLTSCVFLPDDVLEDPFLSTLGVENFIDIRNKIYSEMPGCNNEVSRQPHISMLHWVLKMYNDVEHERIPCLHLLAKAKALTASQIYIMLFNDAINALNRIDTEIYTNEAVDMLITEAKKHNGIFAQMSYNGLREIENDLYEYRLRVKNAETENDVMYAMKQINTRISMLDDYVYQHPNDSNNNRWQNVKSQYIELREELSRKKICKHNYGVFVDYDALDNEEE